MSFDSAFQETVGLEGGFTDEPYDKGNWTGGKVGVGLLKGTKYGISAASYPDLDIRELTLEDAKAIYLRDYWQPMRLDSINHPPIQAELFDTGVNCGTGSAIRIAQKAINFLGGQIAEDGQIGPDTIIHLNSWAIQDEVALFRALNGFQFVHYVEIVTARSDHRFAPGWMKRIQDYRIEKEESFNDLISCHH